MKHSKSIYLFLPVFFLLSACSYNTARIDQFDKFAKAGSEYTKGFEDVLKTSFDAMNAADNRTLIIQRDLVESGEERANALSGLDEQGVARLNVFSKLRKHAKILNEYFVSLAIISNRQEGGAVPKLSSGIADSTIALATQIGGLNENIAKAFKDANFNIVTGSAVPVIVSAYQRNQLDRVLAASGPAISEGINLHLRALQSIRSQVIDDRGFILEDERTRKVVNPFVGTGSLPGGWGDARIKYLREKGRAAEIDSAIKAAEKMQTAYLALLEKSAGGPSFDLLLQDVTALVDFSEKL